MSKITVTSFKILLILTIVLSLAWTMPMASEPQQGNRFERISPQQAGYDPDKLAKLADYLEAKGSSAMLLLHDGKVFFEWGDIHKPHTIHSIRKALVSALIGIAWDDGKIELDRPLADGPVLSGIDDLNETEKTATLRMVMQSRSGIYLPATAESEGMRQAKPARGTHAPGEHFYYNNWDFNFAGHYYEQLTGDSIFQAFDEQIAEPLGMRQYQGNWTTIEVADDEPIPDTDGFYQFERTESEIPAYHFRLSAHDLALFGQLFLNDGRWNGEQIISEEWIRLSTKPESVTNEKFGLAYAMMWNAILPDPEQTAPNAFYHTGTGVHMLGVYPESKLVMVHRVDTENPTDFTGQDLYPIIGMMHGARNRTD